MTPADEARANALPCEMVKYALRQTKDGIVVSFVVHPNDIPAELQTSHIGSRWMAALVQIGDDEQPVHQETAQPSPQATAGASRDKRDWKSLQPQQQAGIRCGEATFIAFLKETRPDDWHESQDAAECVRLICGVHSRVELGINQRARILWNGLEDQYQAWKQVEHA